jgi:hypothetical protein
MMGVDVTKEGIRVVTKFGEVNTNQVPDERATMDRREENKKEDKQGKG